MPSNTRIYLNQIPQDPTQAGIPNKDYQYWSLNWTPSGGYQNCNNTNAICNFFCVSTKLEIAPTTDTNNQFCETNNPSFSYYNYEVDSQNPNHSLSQ